MKKGIILLIRTYQTMPFFSHKMCRFTPTCSEYTIEAIETYGVIKGIKLGLKRICRCNPKGNMGYDPLPKERKDL